MTYRQKGVGPEICLRLLAGESNKAIARSLGVSSATVSHHAKKIGRSHAGRPTYDWADMQRLYDLGVSIEKVAQTFGCAKETINHAIRRGAFVSREPSRYTTAAAYAAESMGKFGRKIRWILKGKILREKIFEYACAVCGITDWQSKKLDLRLDHIDGDRTNHDLKNLRFICPNCDSQQETYSHRNVGRAVAGVGMTHT